MKLVNFKLLALFILVYLAALIVTTPVAWILPLIQPTITSYGVEIDSPAGNLFNGSSNIKHSLVGDTKLSWSVNPLGLVALKVPIDFSVSNSVLSFEGKVTASLADFSVEGVDGYIDDGLFINVIQAYGSVMGLSRSGVTSLSESLSGRLQFVDVSADTGWSMELGDAAGRVTWSGGSLSFPVGRNVETFETPMMIGELSSDEAGWLLNVTGSAGQEYVNAQLKKDGVGDLNLLRPLFEEMDLDQYGTGFSVSEQVFNGL